ncbi:2,3,4,5-tetrahydropyridine-2,6-dicarboxylate N-succinyltransferase [Candidatus Tachikawaea gelatinosa]|uniref:2,3,4,5-tetrahydropyridine-2,6-dicarboxylate N-succinyltransferase n=1 Tax=Candidatus Tachikawaea gelatinosa TaxID=1410383 RepID=A0A090BWD0_9ENTR|nr:2,3,4,5-tetrahydropyridine-2,6-dicarboxylate N-succinyltransferase [Candidatus Tachikawaea gelatinosa]BAP58391.1 2 3 4 5-tetrahydropyridine-2 6-dicarboxylate N-succinyltransferase [Candidatus Tachikawaea gelatinosa]
MKEMQKTIDIAFDQSIHNKLYKIDKITCEIINKIIYLLNQGEIRVSEKVNGSWITNQWIKKAILLFFKIHKEKVVEGVFTRFYDKIPNKFTYYDEKKFRKEQLRIVPSAIARYGSFIGKNSILMPSYVNIGAYVDENTMIDTWVTIGSCAQIGKNVHISGGVGIGGVLEPLQTNPTIIEDNCFIGARSEIVEGVIVEEGAVISMGVYIGQSTKIYDRETEKIYYGKVPAKSVVVPGTLPSKNGLYNLYCAVIVKKVDDKTRNKVNINEILRNVN